MKIEGIGIFICKENFVVDKVEVVEKIFRDKEDYILIIINI